MSKKHIWENAELQKWRQKERNPATRWPRGEDRYRGP